jgi:hypothetical protein
MLAHIWLETELWRDVPQADPKVPAPRCLAVSPLRLKLFRSFGRIS